MYETGSITEPGSIKTLCEEHQFSKRENLHIWYPSSLQLNTQILYFFWFIYVQRKHATKHTQERLLRVGVFGLLVFPQRHPLNESVLCCLYHFYSTSVRFIAWLPCQHIVMVTSGLEKLQPLPPWPGWEAVILSFRSAGHRVLVGPRIRNARQHFKTWY